MSEADRTVGMRDVSTAVRSAVRDAIIVTMCVSRAAITAMTFVGIVTAVDSVVVGPSAGVTHGADRTIDLG